MNTCVFFQGRRDYSRHAFVFKYLCLMNLQINSKMDKMRVILHYKTLIKLYFSLHLLQKKINNLMKNTKIR